MYKLKQIFILIFLILPAAAGYPQTRDTLSVKYITKKLPFGMVEKTPTPRPIVAVALSGGGARGLAQIGVLRAFEENNIPIDIIVGTSMGSVIGGLYASGYSTAEIESIAVNTNWNDLLSVNRESNRRELFIDQKITEDKAVFALRLKGLTPLLPTSINDGQRLSNFLNLLTLQAPLHVENSFDELKVKFRAVCTDLLTGNSVILSKGSLSQAMRASSSVSFFLSPVKMDSLILVDGGLVANIPVKIATELGGEYIVAVNTTSSLHQKDELEYPWIVADQIVSIPMLLLNQAQLEGANLVIKPELNGKTSTDFTGVDSVIEQGYRAALPFINTIKQQIDSILQANLKEKEFYVKNILRGKSSDPVEENILKSYSIKDSVSSYQILSDIYDLFETGKYEDIKVIVSRYDKYSTVSFNFTEKPVIKEIQFAGISLIPRDKIDSVFTPLEGEYFDHEYIADKITAVLKMYREGGYSLAELNWQHFDLNSGTLFLEFDEGIIDSIIIEGNSFTNSNIITREFTLTPGEYFHYDDVERGLRNLRNTNLFEDIILTVNKEDGRNIVVLKVLEKITSLVRVGFRADTEDRVQLSFDIRDENLFGTGTELGLLLFGGIRNRAYVLEHKSNRIFDTYLTYKINAYYQFDDAYVYKEDSLTSPRKFSSSQVGEYRQIYYGASLAVGMQVQRFGNVIFQGKYQYDQLKNKTGIFENPFKMKIVSFKVSSTIDTQDKYPYPEDGIYFQGFFETAQKVLGGDVSYTNLGFDYKNYFTFINGHTISPRLMMGFGDKTLPVTERYSLGGQNSFFGLHEDELWGRQIFLSSLEYRYRLPIKIFFTSYIKMRYDLGSIWNFQEQIRFKDLRHGIGLSLSFDTPLGPADFSMGRSFLFKGPLPKNTVAWGQTQYYFSIGFYY